MTQKSNIRKKIKAQLRVGLPCNRRLRANDMTFCMKNWQTWYADYHGFWCSCAVSRFIHKTRVGINLSKAVSLTHTHIKNRYYEPRENSFLSYFWHLRSILIKIYQQLQWSGPVDQGQRSKSPKRDAASLQTENRCSQLLKVISLRRPLVRCPLT